MIKKLDGQKNFGIELQIKGGVDEIKSSKEAQKNGHKKVSSFYDILQAERSNEKPSIELSKHAQERIKKRNIDFDSNEFLKLKEAQAKLKAKGSKDSLVITSKAAYIVDVENQKIITAMNKENMGDQIVTKIDSTVII